MRGVVQRVARASVQVDGQCVGRIERGLLVFLGVEQSDTAADVQYMVGKVSGLRVFGDAAGLMNLSVQEVGGQVLVISQFTLLGDVRRGRRPSFITAAAPERAEPLYEQFCQSLTALGLQVERGQFQADMQVELLNDGPVTILLDSRKLF